MKALTGMRALGLQIFCLMNMGGTAYITSRKEKSLRDF